MTGVNWLPALTGGILIGLSATLLLALNGQIAGISGILNGSVSLSKDDRWRWFFVLGLVMGGGIYEYLLAPSPTPVSPLVPGTMIVGGFLVGVGTRMSNGCTSGHGVCGLGRLSMRSLVAVLTFMATAIATVYITRHLLVSS